MHAHRIFEIELRLCFERPDLNNTGVIDQNVDAPKSPTHIANKLIYFGLFSNVADCVEHFSTAGRQIFPRSTEFVIVACADRDLRASGRKLTSQYEPETA